MNKHNIFSSYPLIAWFRAAFGDSRLVEFESVVRTISKQQFPWSWEKKIYTLDGGDIGPNLIQELPDKAKKYIPQLAHGAQRTMACKGIFSIIAQGDSVHNCLNKLTKAPKDLSAIIHGSWCFRFFHIGKGNRFSPTQRREIVEHFGSVMPILNQQPVDLTNPDHEFVYLEDHRRPRGVGPITGEEAPHQVFLLYKHPPPKNLPHIREWEEKLSLDRRAFLSPTSMEAQRSLQLSNIALMGDGVGKTIVDPFCGSASLLLSATALGAQCVGSDKLKYLLLRHKRIINIPPSKHRPQRGIEKVSLYDNFLELNLQEPTILHSLDAFSPNAPQKLLEANQGRQFDAMLTDPPYGIRASMRVNEQTLFSSILNLANKLLLPNGRLVFLFPQDPQPPHTHPLHQTAKQCHFRVCSLGWERFQQKQMRMIAVLEKQDY